MYNTVNNVLLKNLLRARMKMTRTTPTMMKVLVSSSVGVGEEGGTEVKPVVRMVGGEGVAEGAVIGASPVGEEGGDGESPGPRADDTIIAVIACKK